MPSAYFQSRINAFETLTATQPQNVMHPIKSQHLLETPIPPSAFSYAAITPVKLPQSTVSRSPSPSPPHLGRKTSLIDLRDWVVDDGPSTALRNGFEVNSKAGNSNAPTQSIVNGKKYNPSKQNSSAGILINLAITPKPPIVQVPPLPLRKASYNSLKSVSSSNSPRNNNDDFTSFQASRNNDTLAVQHTYPPSPSPNAADSPRRASHASASSISSFHSVSLSSDGDARASGSVSNHIATFHMDREGSEVDARSLDESFENISASSIASPSTAARLVANWKQPLPARHTDAPRLPPRSPVINALPLSNPTSPKGQSRPTSASSSSSVRRPAPPPPPRVPSRTPSTRTSFTTSDRSSILSSTATSRTSISSMHAPAPPKLSLATRPTPIPASARVRYEKVFVANVIYCRKLDAAKQPSKKTRKAAGWRGLSVDFITNPGDNPNGEAASEEVDCNIGPDETLPGSIIKLVWNASRLDREILRNIW
jgi:hypothetical protein